jgi:hypothetical protein
VAGPTRQGVQLVDDHLRDQARVDPTLGAVVIEPGSWQQVAQAKSAIRKHQRH